MIILFKIFVGLSFLFINAIIAMYIPRVFGALCFLIIPLAFVNSRNIVDGTYVSIYFMFLGIYNIFILSKKDKMLILRHNIVCWIIFVSVGLIISVLKNYVA